MMLFALAYECDILTRERMHSVLTRRKVDTADDAAVGVLSNRPWPPATADCQERSEDAVA